MIFGWYSVSYFSGRSPSAKPRCRRTATTTIFRLDRTVNSNFSSRLILRLVACTSTIAISNTTLTNFTVFLLKITRHAISASSVSVSSVLIDNTYWQVINIKSCKAWVEESAACQHTYQQPASSNSAATWHGLLSCSTYASSISARDLHLIGRHFSSFGTEA